MGRRCPKCQQEIQAKSGAKDRWFQAIPVIAPLVREVILLLRELT